MSITMCTAEGDIMFEGLLYFMSSLLVLGWDDIQQLISYLSIESSIMLSLSLLDARFWCDVSSEQELFFQNT